ncbi:unnamed protein product [Linum trigynum]|uniref:Reverse transcriptase zinc-binding domain-containing protein n=1 Tax=Linum trigynum TaxID=586398 RepID=A0AAV2GVN6_9ROSI
MGKRKFFGEIDGWEIANPLATFAPDLSADLLDRPIVDFVLNCRWNSQFLNFYLPQHIVLQVELHPVPQESEDDSRCWRFSENGEFTFRSTYELTKDEDQPHFHHPIWRALWKVPSMHRVRTFLWLAARPRLLTNAERHRRHLTSNPTCKICGGHSETITHVLRDCPFDRATWVELLMDEPDEKFFEPDLHRWLHYYITGRSSNIDATLFAITCWLLWKNRNSLCFEGELQTYTQIQYHSLQLRQQIATAFESFVVGDGGHQHIRYISWQPPPPDWACMNTDGSVTHSPSSTAAGGIVRGGDGRFIKAFAVNLGRGSLRLTWETRARKVLLQTDSAAAVSIIEKATHHHPRYTAVAEIRSWLSKD